MSTRDEIEEYLEGKKLKSITLPDNSNDIDQGSDSSNAKEKIGQKNLDKEKRLARAEYVIQRDRKIQAGDRLAINEYMQEQTELRQRLETQRERQLAEYQLLQEEKSRFAKEARITPEDIENEKLDIEKLERKKDKEIANLQDYFNCSEEFWEEYQKNGHAAYESPAGALITQADNGTWCCDIHRYQKVLEMPDRSLGASSFTIKPVEQHFRKDPKPHLEALIEIANNKYEVKINERKQLTLEDPDIKFKKEIREIDSIKTRPGGDWGLLNSGTKITKGDRARIRREEEAQNEKNRKIYRGLYS
jgi:DNA-directed RNA polymerase subunit K/omega